MKKKILIPKSKSFPKLKTKKMKKQILVEEKIELKDLGGYDKQKVARMINMLFTLSDINWGIALDIESEIKKADPSLTLPLRHPIERIKEHAHAMVRFVDNTMDFDQACGFAEHSDNVRDELLRIFGLNGQSFDEQSNLF